MTKEKLEIIFNKKQAASYDEQRKTLAPLKDSLHFSVQMLLSKHRGGARVLIVGGGTGAELVFLARVFPDWHFTVVEPASKMLERCRKRAEENGISSRCTYHEGYVESLPTKQDFDVATSILVSHFLVTDEERRNYYSKIAARLGPKGILVEVCLAADLSSAQYPELLDVWRNMHEYAGMPVKVEALGKDVSLLSPDAVESLVALGGFERPVKFFQTLLIHGWFAKVNA